MLPKANSPTWLIDDDQHEAKAFCSVVRPKRHELPLSRLRPDHFLETERGELDQVQDDEGLAPVGSVVGLGWIRPLAAGVLATHDEAFFVPVVPRRHVRGGVANGESATSALGFVRFAAVQQ